jgi:deoxyribonuclease-4
MVVSSDGPVSRVGSHVAVAGGLVRIGLREADEVGAELIQFFAGNPRAWAPAAVDPRADAVFREACRERGLPVVIHAPHLVNLCSPAEPVLRRSIDALHTAMDRAAALGAWAVVVHAGALVTAGRRAEVLAGLHDLVVPIIDRTPGVRLLIEPTSGAGEAAAATVDTTIEYLLAVDDTRVGLCLDTCHLHAAGEDITDPATFTRITQALGPDRIGLVHVNDSRDPAGSHRDRHESLGLGTIGETGFKALLAVDALRGVPLLVETPTHERDVALLKTLRQP